MSIVDVSAPIRIGTRGSRLARWQAEWVAARLREVHPGLVVELVEIKTHGDRDRNSPLAAIGGAGLFTKEIQQALLDQRVDVAVHSLKDLPTATIEGLMLGAVPKRAPVADGLIAPVARTLEGLPSGARVGTSSLRRQAMLRYERPDLVLVDVRGNVETRLNKAMTGELDAVVLAEAGLDRLGLESNITERLGPPRFLPAPGQGALGIECRTDDERARRVLGPLDDGPTHAAVAAERACLARLEGGCLIPLGAWARLEDEGETLALDAAVYAADGSARLWAESRGLAAAATELGWRVADDLRGQGAEEFLRPRPAPAG